MGNNPSNFSLAKFHSKYFGLLWVKGELSTRPVLIDRVV